MIVLIDADEIAYKSVSHSTVWCKGSSIFKTKRSAIDSATAGEVYSQSVAPQWRTVEKQIDSVVERIMSRVKDKFKLSKVSATLILSGSMNYRKAYYPDYKANRKGRKTPFYLRKAREYIQNKYYSMVSDGEEGDDLMGCLQSTNSVIASSDKDMLTIPGWNYNIIRDVFTELTEEKADINFYSQILIGDIADNIKGAKGIGPVKAARLLEGSKSNVDRLDRVIEAYAKAGRGTYGVEKSGFLLRIRRKPREIWTIEGVRNGTI